MINRFNKTGDFLEKRLVFDRAAGTPGEGETKSSEPQKKAEQSEENLAKVGDYPGLEKPDELKDREERDQSAAEIMKNLGRIFTMKEQELTKLYRDRYPTEFYGAEITFENRRRISEQELTRFRGLASANALREIEAIQRETPKPTYTEALRRITTGQYQNIDNKGTADFIRDLNLDTTNAVALQQEYQRLGNLKTRKQQAELQVIPLEADLTQHRETKQQIDERKSVWDSKKWKYVKPVLKYGAILASVAMAVSTVGGLGSGLLAMKGAEGALDAAGLFGGKLWGGISAVPAALGFGKILSGDAISSSFVGNTGLLGLGIAGYHFGGNILRWGRGIGHGLSELGREFGLERRKEELGILTPVSAINAQIADAEGIIKRHRDKLTKDSAAVGEHLAHYKTAETNLKNEIETAPPNVDRQPLFDRLEAITQMILALESITEVLNAQDAQMAGTYFNEDNILAKLREKPDPKVMKDLQDLASRMDQEFRAEQKKIHEAAYKEKIKKEINALENATLIANLRSFLRGTDRSLPANLEILKTDSPHLYRTLKALAILPPDNLFRVRYAELLLYALDIASTEGNREMATAGFSRLSDELKNYLKARPIEIARFHNNDPRNTELPHPVGNINFETWIKRLQPPQLDILVQVLERIRTGAELRMGRLIDKVRPIKEKIQTDYASIDEPLRNHFQSNCMTRLQEAASKIGPAVSITMPNPEGSLLENVEAMTDSEQLKKIRDLILPINQKLYLDPDTNTLKPKDDAKAEMNSKITAINKKTFLLIRNKPQLVIQLASDLGKPTLPNPSTEHSNSLQGYGENLIGTNKFKPFLETLKELSEDEYDLVDKKLGKSIEIARAELKKQIQKIKDLMIAGLGQGKTKDDLTGDDELTAEKLQIAFRNTALKSERTREVADFPEPGVDLDEKINNIHDLREMQLILKSCKDIVTMAEYEASSSSHTFKKKT